MNVHSDADLVEQTRRDGDKVAFSLLLERHQDGALRMAQRMIAHKDTARDIVQEAMLQAYLSLDSLEKPERFQSWLYGIVINLCRSYLRNQRYDLLSYESLIGGLEATTILSVSHAPDPQTIAETRELHELVIAAIDTLSPQNQEATFLYYYEQLSLREISLMLGISITAVKGRLHKSRRQLAGYFANLASRDAWFPQTISQPTANRIQERKQPMVEVQLVDVIIPEETKQAYHVVVLLDDAGQRVLPIWIGPFEAQSIAMYLLGNKMVPRPMTYDFMANLLKATGATVKEIQISGLQEGTYYATVMLSAGDTTHQIDARPSDALALALRMNSRISVDNAILEKAGMAIPDKYKNQVPRKGLEQLAAQLEKAKAEHAAMMAKFKEAKAEEKHEAFSAADKLFVHLFGE